MWETVDTVSHIFTNFSVTAIFNLVRLLRKRDLDLTTAIPIKTVSIRMDRACGRTGGTPVRGDLNAFADQYGISVKT
jgi:hypothetical protein